MLLERSDRSRNAGESVMHWLFPLHSGTAFGKPGMIAMCLTGAAPFLLVFTGLWVWLRKRRAAAFELRRRMGRSSRGAGIVVAENPASEPRTRQSIPRTEGTNGGFPESPWGTA